MSVRKPLGLRKAALGGAVALALTGTGVAFAWSANDSPPPALSSSSSPGKSDKAPGQNKGTGQNKAPGQDKPDKSQRPQHLHSESVVKKADGTFETEVTHRGTVESVSDTSITVRSEDGYSQAYTVAADTKIRVPAPSADGSAAKDDGGKRLKRADGTMADIAAGDGVRISGVKAGDAVTAESIVEGAGGGPGFGLGRGHGPK